MYYNFDVHKYNKSHAKKYYEYEYTLYTLLYILPNAYRRYSYTRILVYSYSTQYEHALILSQSTRGSAPY